MDSTLHKTKDSNLTKQQNEYNIDAESSEDSSDTKIETEALIEHINPKFLKLLCPDGSEYISMESLKNMIKTALGARFSDDEISLALNDLGFPNNEPIHYGVFLNLISKPLTSALAHLDESFGDWLTTEDWQEAMSRIGVELSKDEIELAVEQTKKRILENNRTHSAMNCTFVDAKDTLPSNSVGGDFSKENQENNDNAEESEEDFVDVSEEFILNET